MSCSLFPAKITSDVDDCLGLSFADFLAQTTISPGDRERHRTLSASESFGSQSLSSSQSLPSPLSDLDVDQWPQLSYGNQDTSIFTTQDFAGVADCTPSKHNKGHFGKRTRAMSRAGKDNKNSYERKRLHNITGALDEVQGAVWKERVSKDHRRKKTSVLRRATDYIRLLQDAADGALSEELEACLRYYVANKEDDSGSTSNHALMLQLLLQGHEKEMYRKSKVTNRTH